MHQEKPKDLEPQRNHLCRYYEDCLETAAIKNLPGLPCQGCKHEQDQGGRQNFRDYVEGSWALIHALFYPRKKESEGENTKTLLEMYCSSPVDYDPENNEFPERSCKSPEE
jgi:hypothetical protein